MIDLSMNIGQLKVDRIDRKIQFLKVLPLVVPTLPKIGIARRLKRRDKNCTKCDDNQKFSIVFNYKFDLN